MGVMFLYHYADKETEALRDDLVCLICMANKSWDEHLAHFSG